MLGSQLDAREYLVRLQQELGRLDIPSIQRTADLVFQAWKKDRFVYIFGNGGASTTAEHMVEDLGKNLLPKSDVSGNSQKRLRVISLTDNSGWITALANDLSFEEIFVQQLMNFGRRGDLAIAMSGSGNSPNVIKAVQWANDNGLTTIGLSGFDGGKLKSIQQEGIHVPVSDMGMVQSIHLCIFHWILDHLFARIHRLEKNH